jgi:hypothetical protein
LAGKGRSDDEWRGEVEQDGTGSNKVPSICLEFVKTILVKTNLVGFLAVIVLARQTPLKRLHNACTHERA